MSAQSWEKDILWCKNHLAAGGKGGLKLHDWKHPAFSEDSGYGFLAKLSSYKLKPSTSAALAFFLGILVLLMCDISFKRIFLDSSPVTAAVSHTCYPLWR